MSLDLLKRVVDYQKNESLEDWSIIMADINATILASEQAAELRGNSGAWDFETALKEHAFSLELAWHIYQLVWPTNSVYDLGAGPGFYTQFLKQRGLQVKGFDKYQHKGLSLCDIEPIDLSQPVELIGKAGTVLCLEVGEHIDAEFESIVINNICKLAKEKIILSWAVPGQGGYGHVNCQPNDYIIEAIERFGWCFNAEESQLLRDHCSACPWFENTIMVFDLKPFK